MTASATVRGTRTPDRSDLGDFLRRRRESLRPADVGLEPGARRRTPGLRRDEVAALATMSVDYYERLEQARGPQPSAAMLASIATALRLTPAERDHLYLLAGQAPPAEITPLAEEDRETVDPGLRYVLDTMAATTPAYVSDDLGTILAQNPLNVALFGQFAGRPGHEANLIWHWFTSPQWRSVLSPPADQEPTGRAYIADLRTTVVQRGHDRASTGLVADLRAASPEFARMWDEHEVGSWCWSLVTEELAARGIPSVAVDLAGHGLRSRSPQSRWGRPFDPQQYAGEPSAVAGITASSAGADLVEQIRRIGRGRPCVVVAHSMGGVVATAAAEQAPGLVAELVYVTAFAPVSGLPAGAYIEMPENAGEQVSRHLVADPFAVGALRIDPADPATADTVRQTFYHDVDEVTALAAIGLLGADGPAGVPGEALTVTAARYGTVGHSYVVCTQDQAVPVALQRRFVQDIDAVSAKPTTVVELDTSHSPFLSRPDALADVIEAAARS